MKRNRHRAPVPTLILFFVVAVSACVDNSGHSSSHLCSKDNNSEWSGLPNIGIDHVDPGNCDVQRIAAGMSGGGTIYQNSGVTWPNSGRYLTGILRVYDTYVTTTFTGSTLLASDQENFGWSDIDGRWEAPVYASFVPGLNPDYLEWQVLLCNPGCNNNPYPTAWMEISYAGEPE